MRTHAFCILAAAVLLVIAQPSMVGAVERAEAEETARLLAKLLQSGRMVIERNQTLIDDPHKGEKGFTPELFEQQLVREFLAKTGIDLTALPAAPFHSRTIVFHPYPAVGERTLASAGAGQPGSGAGCSSRHQPARHRL